MSRSWLFLELRWIFCLKFVHNFVKSQSFKVSTSLIIEITVSGTNRTKSNCIEFGNSDGLWMPVPCNYRRTYKPICKKDRIVSKDWRRKKHIPYARHYNPRFVFILPHFSLRFIFESGLYCREVSIYMNLFSSKVTTKNKVKYILFLPECRILKNSDQIFLNLYLWYVCKYISVY